MAVQVTRGNVSALETPEIASDIIQGVVSESATLALFTQLPNMTKSSMTMPVLNMLPEAYWVNESKGNGRKQTTKMAWDKKYLIPEELAVIIAIKENVLNDSDYDLWAQIRPRVIEAFGKKIDQAVWFGLDKPQSFPADLISAINDASAYVENDGDLYKAVSDAMGKVEESDYNPTALVGSLRLKKAFRDLLDTSGQPIRGTEVDTLTKHYVTNGAWDKTKALAIVGDFKQAVYSIRQDITVKMLTEGVISDDDGNIVYNLAQDDMVALRFVMRIGWAIPNPITAEAPDEAKRFPFAAIKGDSGITEKTVTFTVQDSSESVVEGARVLFGNDRAKYTNASGEAAFKVQAGLYDYVVTYNGDYVEGTVDAGSESEKTVKLNVKKN